LKRHLLDYGQLFLIAGIVILLDQLTKNLIRTNIPMGTVFRPDLYISQFIRIVHWKNSGAAFGMFQNMNTVFQVLSILVSLVILYYFPQVPRNEWYLRIAMGFLLGGAIGNLIDRFIQGHVTDFISIGNFPVFNVADASISTGVAILFIGMWIQERQKKMLEGEPGIKAEETSLEPETSAIPEESQGE
jgi:signal peptidase II